MVFRPCYVQVKVFIPAQMQQLVFPTSLQEKVATSYFSDVYCGSYTHAHPSDTWSLLKSLIKMIKEYIFDPGQHMSPGCLGCWLKHW